jgi:EpsD family peptidyl-prolyl cis-trans isomerase
MSALLMSLALASCGGGGSGEKNKTQVVARVNGEEITVHQLNQALRALGPAAANNTAAASKNALEGLVNQTIGVQEAIKQKLDREPDVLQAIESSRQRMLLDAYLAKRLQNTVAPTQSEVHTYYTQHPELFSNRRLYVFNQLAAKAGKENVASLSNKLAEVKKLDEYIIWLKEKGVEYNLVTDAKPSEQLPMALLANMQKILTGGIGYLKAKDGVVAVEILQSVQQPLNEVQARPFIERYLGRQKQMAAAQKLLTDLRASAKVEYLGDFKPTTADKAGNTLQTETKAPVVPSIASPEKSQDQKSDSSHITEGLKGL